MITPNNMSSDAKVCPLGPTIIDIAAKNKYQLFSDHERDWEIVSVTLSGYVDQTPTGAIVKLKDNSGRVYLTHTLTAAGLDDGKTVQFNQKEGNLALSATLLTKARRLFWEVMTTAATGVFLANVLIAPLSENPTEKTINAVA